MYIEPTNNAVLSQNRVVKQAETGMSTKAESTEGEAEKKATEMSPAKEASSINAELSERQAVESEKIRKAIEKMNAQLPNSEAKFGIHEQTNRVMIKLVDKETKELIKEIPPEKTLDMIAKCMEIAGVLVDEKL